MSGTRFARSGRFRLFACLALLLLLALAVYHSSQQQLDETRKERLHCEHQQEALNERLQSAVEQKFNMEKNYDHERNEQMETLRTLEQNVNDLTKLETETRLKFEKLQHSHNLLQNEHKKFIVECSKFQNEAIESKKQLQLSQIELQKEKTLQNNEISLWKDKYNAIMKEKDQLEKNLNKRNEKVEVLKQLNDFENVIKDYQLHCTYRPNIELQQNINKLLDPSVTKRNDSVTKMSTRKTFKEQLRILQNKFSGETKTLLKTDAVEKNSGIKNHVLPLGVPHKPTSTEPTKSKVILEEQAHLKKAPNSSSVSTSSSTGLPPLALPLNQHKIPENVAPIPANFEELLKIEGSNQKLADKISNNEEDVGGDIADIDAAVEETQKNEHENDNNNRYGNIDQHGENVGNKAGAAEDSGAHEIKDHDFLNDQNFNLPVDDDNNFFDGVKNEAMDTEKHKDVDNDGEDMMGAGNVADIAVKSPNLLDTDNLNNEIVGDQGKEFPDLRLDDGNEEDEDEDDYSNPAVRLKGAHAIRN